MKLLSAHPWTPPERLSQQTGTCSPTFPPTRNTQFPFNDSDKTNPLPRISLLVLLNRKASLITSQSSPPTYHSHLHFLASLSLTQTRMEPCLCCWAWLPVSLSQPTRSCPLQGTGLGQVFPPGTQIWPCKTESTTRSTQVRRFTEAGYPSAQLWGLQGHLLLPMAFFPKSDALLLSSGIRIDQDLVRRTHHSPWFLVSMKSAPEFFHPWTHLQQAVLLAKTLAPPLTERWRWCSSVTSVE